MLTLSVQGVETLLQLPYDKISVGNNPIGSTMDSLYYGAFDSGCVLVSIVL